MGRPLGSPWPARTSPWSSRRRRLPRRPRLPHACPPPQGRPRAIPTGASAMSRSAIWRSKAGRSGRLPSRSGCIGKPSRSMSEPTVSRSGHDPQVCSIPTSRMCSPAGIRGVERACGSMRRFNAKGIGVGGRPCSATSRNSARPRGWPRGRARCQPGPPVTDPSVPCCTPRQATWLVLRQPDHLTAEEQALLDRLRQAHPAFAQAIALAQGFAQLLRARQPERLDTWLQQAATSSLAALQRFAKSFQRDYAAVKAGVTLPWSTSPVEGHINRLKMLKRHMFGRARLDLLSRRFVLTPRQGPGTSRRPTGAVTGLRSSGVALHVANGVGGPRAASSGEDSVCLLRHGVQTL